MTYSDDEIEALVADLEQRTVRQQVSVREGFRGKLYAQFDDVPDQEARKIADALRQLLSEVRKLRAENFDLAGTQCHIGYGDESGNWRCAYQDEIVRLRAEPKGGQEWRPQFDVMAPEQERLVQEFCVEIAGRIGERPRRPDPVRLLEMAQALYDAEREHYFPTPPQDGDA